MPRRTKFLLTRGAVLIPPPCRLQEASFDAVTCQYGLQFTAANTVAFREAARVLRPGGLFVAAVTGGESQMDQVCAVPCSPSRR